MTRNEAITFITRTNGRIFAVEFIKRGDGSLRLMNCRTGVVSHAKTPARDWDGTPTVTLLDHHHNLVSVFDMTKLAYRSIPVEGIQRIKIGGVWHPVTQ